MWAFVTSWAALGVALSGGTQLRLPGLPIGPSEVVLAAWMLFVSFHLMRGVSFVSGRVFLVLVIYWVSALILLGFGTLVALETREFNPDLASHDALAFAYAAALTSFLSLGLGSGNDGGYHLQLGRKMFLFTALATSLLFGISQITEQLGSIHLWYFGVRFRGWAENPNQMALAVVAMPFLGWYLLKRARGFARRVGYGLAIACCIATGIATGSDALRVSWALTSCTLAGLLWCRAIVRGRGSWLYLSHILVPLFIAILGAFNADKLIAVLGGIVEELYEQEGQGSLRVALWMNGLRVIGASPLVGFGPGPFSGVDRPFLGNEAHNALIDWGMSAGLLGILLHLALWVWCAWRAIKSGSLPLLGVAVSIFILSQFHYGLRQPIYWMMLVLLLRLAERRSVLPVRATAASPHRTPMMVAAELTRDANSRLNLVRSRS